MPALAVLSSDGEFAMDSMALLQSTSVVTKASYSMRGAQFLHEANRMCDPIKDPNCAMESTRVLILLISLCATIVLVICAFSFFREDREEQITPLCPQLVVKDSELKFRLPALPLFAQGDPNQNMDVMDSNGNCVCKISMDWPDPFRGSPHGVAATVRVHKSDMTLATIVARNVAVLGQGLALCRTGCEIFGFVEPDGNKYIVRHRTGVHLLTLIGSFDHWDIEGVNPVGSKVCSMKMVGDECVGKVCQHVDAGLILCALMATYVHRRLSQPWSSTASGVPRPMPALGALAPGDDPRIVVAPPRTEGQETSPKAGAVAEAMDLGQLQASDISQFRSPSSSMRDTRQEGGQMTPEPPLLSAQVDPAAGGAPPSA